VSIMGIVLKLEDGGKRLIAGVVFELTKFIFHSPSENTLEGEHFRSNCIFVHST